MKTIIITGANGNLGVATVKQFLQEGYKVIAVDSAGSNLQFALDNANFELHSINLTDEAATAAFAEQVIVQHKQVHAALMLVGGFTAGDINTSTGAELQKMFALNFQTAFFLSRSLFSHMQSSGYGRLVFIGARPALQPQQGKGLIAYALTKSLLFNFAEMLNEEAKGSNVVTSVVVPSTIDTELNRKSMPDADPANWVKPEQLADVMELLLSEKGDALREPVLKVYNNA